ncbi:hypothetical protein AN936_17720 [Sphingopyxis macrogoltabida]|uniref:Peptidase S9A N-terminal domain-containing protein n=1 Tax=Sphingopyxis macrogoltabida TaxID=33050 RepID=A0A0N9UF98_SPHMC|nr:hypothetical protein AN936_17720 [Sphingopyxis macrogoltabida]
MRGHFLFAMSVSGLMLMTPPAARAAPETAATAAAAPIAYPQTRRDNVVEDHFGQKVADPYRWLENDVCEDRQVAAWVEAQNKVTSAAIRDCRIRRYSMSATA